MTEDTASRAANEADPTQLLRDLQQDTRRPDGEVVEALGSARWFMVLAVRIQQMSDDEIRDALVQYRSLRTTGVRRMLDMMLALELPHGLRDRSFEMFVVHVPQSQDWLNGIAGREQQMTDDEIIRELDEFLLRRCGDVRRVMGMLMCIRMNPDVKDRLFGVLLTAAARTE